MTHAHRQRAVDARSAGNPLVGELDVLGVVRCHGHDLLAPVAGLGHPVRVGGAGHGDVRAPHDEVARVPPVARFGDVGLVAEHLRGGVGQIGIPVVERQHRCADELEEPRARRVGHGGHRGDRREARDPVRSPALDGVDVRCGDHLDDFVPARPHQPALAARAGVCRPRRRILLDRRPGDDRIADDGLGGAELLEQDAADVGVANPGGGVGVPGEGGATRAAARLVFGAVRPGRRIVGLLGLPGDDPVLDVDLPRAGPGAVDAVGRTDDLVVGPAVPVEAVALTPPDLVQGAAVVGHRGAFGLGEKAARADQGVREGAVQTGRLGCGGTLHLGGHRVSPSGAAVVNGVSVVTLTKQRVGPTKGRTSMATSCSPTWSSAPVMRP